MSVGLVLCLNIGFDPPDVVKIKKCARLECWIDPLSIPLRDTMEIIGRALKKQYELLLPRAHYNYSFDPIVEDVKMLCSSLRRKAKNDRVLFHYNGHGVPLPTVKGDIWVFNEVSRPKSQTTPLKVPFLLIIFFIYRSVRSTFHFPSTTYRLVWVPPRSTFTIVRMPEKS